MTNTELQAAREALCRMERARRTALEHLSQVLPLNEHDRKHVGAAVRALIEANPNLEGLTWQTVSQA